MKRLVLAMSTFLFLGACATKPTPELFQGASGWSTVPNTTKLLSNTVEEEEIIAEREVKFVRTGTLLTDVKNMLGIVKMKAGSPVYAASYGQGYAGAAGGYGRLAWCAPAGEVSNLGTFITGENDVECLMFEPRTGKATRTDGNSKSRFFAANMSPTNTMVPLPEIREEPVDFGRRFTLRLMADWFDGKTVDTRVMFHDGEDQTAIQTQKIKYDDNNSALWSVWGGQLRLTRAGTKDTPMLDVEQVKPFTDINLTQAQLTAILNSLMAQATAAAAETEAETEAEGDE